MKNKFLSGLFILALAAITSSCSLIESVVGKHKVIFENESGYSVKVTTAGTPDSFTLSTSNILLLKTSQTVYFDDDLCYFTFTANSSSVKAYIEDDKVIFR